MSGTDDEVEQELVSPELAPEYLRNLQEGLDTILERSERLAERVRKLEEDRDVLRHRLAAARALADGRSLRGRLRRRPRTDPPPAPPAGAGPPGGGTEPDSVVLPGVGRIGPVAWPEPDPPRDLRIALVADTFTTVGLQYEADCLQLAAPDASRTLEKQGADLLFVESAYQGLGGTWTRRIARFGSPHEDLVRLVDTARSLGIPTVFWNKEDPVNTDWFLASSALFEHVFTVDQDRVSTYRNLHGHDSVHVLQFAAQPRIHRPPERFEDRTGPILFAGSWFARKHPERRRQMEVLLDPARRHGLHILDRHANDDPRFTWPRRFRPHIVGSLPYPLSVEATRRYRIAVNVNTVTDSPTMCARRVFELAACATPIVSGPSRAIEQWAPSEGVLVARDRDEVNAAYEELLGHPDLASRVGAVARDWALSQHTWQHRVARVLELCC